MLNSRRNATRPGVTKDMRIPPPIKKRIATSFTHHEKATQGTQIGISLENKFCEIPQ